MKEKRELCDKLASKIKELDKTVCDSVQELSDYFYMHPAEFREAVMVLKKNGLGLEDLG